MSETETEHSGNRAYLSLGSNIEPERNLPAAVRLLARYGRILAVSSVWESRPLGFAAQANFLNAALLMETPCTAKELRETVIAGIETELGRIRGENRNGPRTIDIDIMLFNRECCPVGSRTIPDPEVRERPFVAIPLAEIDPDYIHPETGERLADIARRFDPDGSGMRQRPDVILDRE
jgi:2-amino-4-hydroxy-6-hydroxymethyldihydropteridine diphosphokinase